MLSFVDANIFLRLFVDDDSRQTEQSAKLFELARQGQINLVTGPPVLFEIAWVLRHRYKTDNARILDILEAIISFPNMKVTDKELAVSALFLARETKSEFADAYIAASAAHAQADNVATFNRKHFTKLRSDLYPLDK